MELTHPSANSTSAVTNNPVRGDQPNSFSWASPAFPVQRAPAQSANPARVRGEVLSHRPRFTDEKRARIVREIKASRTDLVPSFPQPVSLAIAPAQPLRKYQLTDVISRLAQGTKSYYDSLTGQALELYYRGESPDQKKARFVEQQAKFIDLLQQSGLTMHEATEVVLAWTAHGIPLNAYTVPRFLKEKVSFSASDLQRTINSEAAIIDVTWEGIPFILKCHRPVASMELEGLDVRMRYLGTPVAMQRREVRCLLASHIAHQLFGWDITPEASLAFVGGRVCVVTPRVEGVVLGEFFKNNLRLFLNYLSSVSDKSLHLDTWGDRFAPEFKKDYIRLALLAKVVGDVDRHLGQFLVSTENRQLLSITGIDWDMAFSSTVNADRCTLPGGVLAWWPDPIAQDIVDEFNKVADNDLKAMATAFEMSPDEVDAILSRFHDVQARLATIRKT